MASGYSTRLVVTGMTSAADAQRVEQVLAAVAGEGSARADPASGMVAVRHEEAVTTGELVAALEQAGFRARHALPGEGSPAYASSPWGVLRPAGRTPAQEVALYRLLSIAGLVVIVLIAFLPVQVFREDNVRMLAFVLASVAQTILGARFYAGAWRELAGRRPGTDFLIALASTAAYLFGVSVAFGQLTPYPKFDVLATLTVFGTPVAILTAVTLGRLVETMLMHRAGSALRALIELAPPTARVLRGTEERGVLACDLVAGDLVTVAPGERFPADGTVTEGRSAVDESVLTGEALPVPKDPGDLVLGGTINGNGRLVFRAEQVCSETALAKMVRRLSEAGQAHPTGARTGQRLSRVIVLGATLMAAAAFVSSYFYAVEGGARAAATDQALAVAVQDALFRAVAILLVACPWALLTAVPGAYAAAVARAAREGIIFRSGAVLEASARVRGAVFLRSGILTLGRPDLVRTVKADGAGLSDDEILVLASSLAEAAGYSLSRPLREAAAARALARREVSDGYYFPGLGARGRLVGGEELILGRRAFLAKEGVDVGPLSARAAELECAGLTVRFLAASGRTLALLAFSDPVRPGAAQVTASLAAMGVASYVLSGEAPTTVGVLAGQTGIAPDNVCSDVRPGERFARLKAIRERTGGILAVGNGEKDGDLLRTADVGVAIGDAEPSANTSLITLIGGDLHGVRRVLCLARDMARTARVNRALAVGGIIVGLPLAAVLVPKWVNPVQVVLATVLVALLVALNSYRLARESGK
jgi:Cu+-exporting ATPase